jgi:hypothetical protein
VGQIGFHCDAVRLRDARRALLDEDFSGKFKPLVFLGSTVRLLSNIGAFYEDGFGVRFDKRMKPEEPRRSQRCLRLTIRGA